MARLRRRRPQAELRSRRQRTRVRRALGRSRHRFGLPAHATARGSPHHGLPRPDRYRPQRPASRRGVLHADVRALSGGRARIHRRAATHRSRPLSRRNGRIGARDARPTSPGRVDRLRHRPGVRRRPVGGGGPPDVRLRRAVARPAGSCGRLARLERPPRRPHGCRLGATVACRRHSRLFRRLPPSCRRVVAPRSHLGPGPKQRGLVRSSAVSAPSTRRR